jgi:hypothetical protein
MVVTKYKQEKCYVQNMVLASIICETQARTRIGVKT